jgi:hypothetical protein
MLNVLADGEITQDAKKAEAPRAALLTSRVLLATLSKRICHDRRGRGEGRTSPSSCERGEEDIDDGAADIDATGEGVSIRTNRDTIDIPVAYGLN